MTAEFVSPVSSRLESIGVTSNAYPKKRVGQTRSNRYTILAHCTYLHVNKEQTHDEVVLVIAGKYYFYHPLSDAVPTHGMDRKGVRTVP